MTVRVEIDGRIVEVAAGTRILEAALVAGVSINTLCWDPRLPPYGACRVCLVGVEGAGGPVPACTTPVRDAMVVRTDDAQAKEVARTTLELIASELPERALNLPPERSELVQVCQAFGVDGSRFSGERREEGLDHSHPYVKLDRDLCIACGRCVRMCDEVQGTFALEMVGRGFGMVVAPGAGEAWVDSSCVACGGCVSSCPTGALSEAGFLDLRPIEQVTTTTCGYCGVGCTLDVHTRGEEIAAITPNLEGAVNHGHACVKGRFAHGFVRSPDRLARPLVRREGRLEETSWDEAIRHAAGELRRIIDTYGPDAVGAISSSRATNEENYLFQKLMRTVIRTHNIDNCARLCHAPSSAGLMASLGQSGATNPFSDVERSDCIIVAGANMTEAHPVAGARIKQRAIDGARLIVIDPRRIELADYADVHLQGRAGTNVAIFNGLAYLLVEEGFCDLGYIAERTQGFDELRRLLMTYTPDAVEAISGVPAQQLRRAGRLYGEACYASIYYGLGITEHAHGTDGVRTLTNLGLLTGRIGTDRGGGINPLRGQNNVQGASDMGALPDLLPGYQRVDDDEVASRFEASWGVHLKRSRGLRIPEMFDSAVDGRLKALWIMGEDIRETDPDTPHVDAALDACELVICQEIFLSKTAERADVVFPAASFLEKDGSFVNFDRHVQRVRPALGSPGGARTDFEILHLVARALGGDLLCATPADAMEECARLTPTFAGISHRRLDKGGALVWPCRSPEDSGEPRLYCDEFDTPNGKATLYAREYLPPGEPTDGSYPLTLITGRRLVHYNSGTMTRRTDDMRLLDHETLEIHPDDASALGVFDGALVKLSSRRGTIQVRAAVTDAMIPGEVFMAFHFPDSPANALTSAAVDDVTGCPEYKVTAVQLRSAASSP